MYEELKKQVCDENNVLYVTMIDELHKLIEDDKKHNYNIVFDEGGGMSLSALRYSIALSKFNKKKELKSK